MPEIDGAFREMMSEEQYYVTNEMGRQDKFESRMVEKVLRAGGATPGYLVGVRRENNDTFDWLNRTQSLRVKFAAKRLGKETSFDTLLSDLHRGKAKGRIEVKHLRDLVDSFEPETPVCLILRYPDYGHDVVVHNRTTEPPGDSAVTLFRMCPDSAEELCVVVQRFDQYLASVVKWYDWRLVYDR